MLVDIYFYRYNYWYHDIQITRRCDLNFVKQTILVVCFSINTNVLNIWHERLDYLTYQNVIKLIHNINIDFFKFLVSNFYVFREKKNDKTKFHKTLIQSNRHSNDFIHENLINFFLSIIITFVIWFVNCATKFNNRTWKFSSTNKKSNTSTINALEYE